MVVSFIQRLYAFFSIDFSGNGVQSDARHRVMIWGDEEAICTILEKEVIPLYYKVDGDGILRDWVNIMKEAMKSTDPVFSARRMVEEYARKVYQNALKSAWKPS